MKKAKLKVKRAYILMYMVTKKVIKKLGGKEKEERLKGREHLSTFAVGKSFIEFSWDVNLIIIPRRVTIMCNVQEMCIDMRNQKGNIPEVGFFLCL